MRLLKQFGFKLIVVLCVISTLYCFVVNTPISYASKVKTDDFYYSGVQKGSYTVDKGFLEKLVNALGEILDYMLGILTMAIRIVFVGWTALLEKLLTDILEGITGTEINVADVEPTNIMNPDDYITVEAIVFNKVFLFNINIFDLEVDNTHDSLGHELKKNEKGEVIEKSDIGEDSFIIVIKETIAGWYYTFRLISLMLMLILLIYIGVKLAISSSTKERAVYKRVLTDWVVGMVLVFSIHYIILAMISFNEMLVGEISKLNTGYGGEKAVYEYGIKERGQQEISNEELEESVYDEVRTRAYDAKLTVGTVGMIMYMILVYYAWKFSFIYLKRYLVVAVLVMMAPFVAVSYAYNKVRTGKTVIFTNWFKELFFIIILQSIHALLYVIFFREALAMSLKSIGAMILSFVMLHFISNAEEIFKKIFSIDGNLTKDVSNSKLKDIGNLVSGASLGIASSKVAAQMSKTGVRIASKPVRAITSAVVGIKAEQKANELGSDFKEAMEIARKDEIAQREKSLLLGNAASMLPERGNGISESTKESIEEIRKRIGSEKSYDEFVDELYENQEEYLETYDKLNSLKERLKYTVRTKMAEITDPFQFVEMGKDGKYRRKKAEYENENWGPLFKHLSKKKKGVNVELSKYFSRYTLVNFNYILDLDNNRKATIKQYADLMKSTVLGFSGLLIGLPMAIVDPGVGFAFLAKGISYNTKVWGRQNRIRARNLKGIVMTNDGKYHFVGYAGKSVETIADGINAAALENAERIDNARNEHNRKLKRTVRKHKKLYSNLTQVGNMQGGRLANLHQIESFSPTSNPVRAFTTIATGNVLTGRLFGNFQANAYFAFHDSVRRARRKAYKELYDNTEDLSDRLSSADKFIDHLIKQVDEVEKEKRAVEKARISNEIGSIYGQRLEAIKQSVNNMSDQQLILESLDSDEEDLKVINLEDGRKQLSVDSERSVIDKSIVEVAQKNGITNLEEYDLEKDKAKLEQVKKVITDRLTQKGVINNTETAIDIISNLDNKIKDEKKQLEKSNPNIVRDKLIDEAIVDEMKAKGLTDVSQLDSDSISKGVKRKIGDEPTAQTNNVIADMRKAGKKASQGEELPTENKGLEQHMSSAIQARSSVISSKLQTRLDDQRRNRMKEDLMKKKIKELDSKIVSSLNQQDTEDSINQSGTSFDQTNEENMVYSDVENSQSTKSEKDAVIEMLLLNGKLEKMKAQKVEATRTSSEFRKNGYIDVKKLAAEMERVDSQKREFVDGTRVVTDRYNSRVDRGMDNTDILSIISKVKKEKNI